jgi:hypothetical protein
MDLDASGELTRDGTTLRLRFPPCWCGEVFTCAARADDGAIDLDITLDTRNASCDACLEGTVTCTIPPLRPGTMRVLNDGRPLAELRVATAHGTRPSTETCSPTDAPVTLVHTP